MNLIALFDHEEIGSRSKQGAGSILLHDMLVRILTECGLEKEVWNRLYNSMILSVDVAHGLHPNYAGKMDLTNKPVLGKGFCIKEACSQSYATDCGAVAVIQQICEKDQIPYQKFVNRSDLARRRHIRFDRISVTSGKNSRYRNPIACNAFCKRTGGSSRPARH